MKKIYIWLVVFVCCLTIAIGGNRTLSKDKTPETRKPETVQVNSPIPDKVAYEFLITFLTEWKDKYPAGIEAYLSRDKFNLEESNVIDLIINEHKMKVSPIEKELHILREKQKNKDHSRHNENDPEITKMIELGNSRAELIVEATAKLHKHLGNEGNKKLENLINRIKSRTKLTTDK